MTLSYHAALTKLLEAQKSLTEQDISKLPKARQADLVKSRAGVFAEIQALQAQQMSAVDEGYSVVTPEFKSCQASLQNLSDWLANQANTDGKYLDLVSQGVGLALSLLA